MRADEGGRWAGIPTSTSYVPDGVYEALQRRRTRRGAQAEWDGALRRLARRRTPSCAEEWDARLGRHGRCPAWPTRCRHRLAARTSSPRARPAQKAMAAFAPFVADDGRRRRRPQRSRRRPSSPAATRPLHRAAGRAATSSSACASTAMGARRQRHGRARRHRAALRLDVPAVRRLHARRDPPVGADGPARRVGLHARLRRARRGRPDAPAGRAPRRAARDPGPDGAAPGRRDGDRRGVARRSSRSSRGRRALVLSRQDLPVLDRAGRRRRRRASRRGAYVLRDVADAARDASSATGSEVSVALAARDLLTARRHPHARRLDAELGALRRSRTTAYQEEVAAGRSCRRSRSRPAITMGWERWVDAPSGSTASAPRRRASSCSRSSASPPSGRRARARAARLSRRAQKMRRSAHAIMGS